MIPVTVLIPCYNDGLTVGEAVGSALAESPEIVLVVDDGSNDGYTTQVLDALASDRVKVIRQSNTGLAGARMRGLREVTTPFVMALDADDRLAHGALSAMYDVLAANPSLSLVWGDIERFGQVGYLRYTKACRLDPWRITYMNELVGTTLMRVSDVLTAGGWTLNDPFEDWDLWMAMAERGMLGEHIGRVTIQYRVNQPRMYLTATKRHDELFEILRLRHPNLFENRRVNRRHSSSSLLLKVAWTVVGDVSLPRGWKRYVLRAVLLLCEPSRRNRRRQSKFFERNRAPGVIRGV